MTEPQHDAQAGSPEVRTIPLQGTVVVCPRCFTAAEKGDLIARLLSTTNKPDSKGMLIAICYGCGLQLPLLVIPGGGVGLVDLDPYADSPDESQTGSLPPDGPRPASDGEADAAYEQAVKAFGANDYGKALVDWRAAYSWYAEREEDILLSSSLLCNIGMAYSRMHHHARALECYDQALRNMPVEASFDAYATLLNNVGATYLHLGRMEEAEEYHRRAYEVHQANLTESALMTRERNNLAFTYAKMVSRSLGNGALDDAVELARKGAALYPDGRDGSLAFVILGNVLGRRGHAAAKVGQLREAVELYRQAVAAHETAATDARILAADYASLTRVQRELGLLDEVLVSMQRADELLEQIDQSPPRVTMMKRRAPLSIAVRKGIHWLRTKLTRRPDDPE